MIDWEKVKSELEYLALGEHMGDVNNALPALAELLELGDGEWDDERDRIVFSWETPEDIEE